MPPDRAPERIAVLHIASGDLWAGAEAQLWYLAARLVQAAGLDLTVVVLNDGELARRLVQSGVATVVLDETKLSGLQILRRLMQEIRARHVDVVHTHRMKENVLGAIASRLLGRRSLRTVHGAEEHDVKGRLTRRSLALQLDRWTGRHLQQAVVAVAAHLLEPLTRVYGADRVVCIPNGIPAPVSPVEKAPRHDAIKVVGFVGRLVDVKRVDIFLGMAAELVRRTPGRYLFEIVGEGPLLAQLRAEADRLQLGGACSFEGFRADALAMIAGMDVLLLCSDHEGTPMVALEALALGVPLVAHAVGGLPAIVCTHSQGALVASQAAAAYADAVEQVLSSDAVSGPRESRLPAQFDIARTAAAYLGLYQRLASQRVGVRVSK